MIATLLQSPVVASPTEINQEHTKQNKHHLILPKTESMRRLLGSVTTTPSLANGTKLNSSSFTGGSDGNFDTNMVIILAALLCALVCALGLNSIVRCALRCGRRLAFETPEEAAARLAATGLKKQALSKIPVAVYGPEANIPATDCPICLGEFADGEKVRVLPKCHHGFHVRCIDTWLASHSSCPTCRHSVLDRGSTGDAAVDAGDRSARQNDGVAVVVNQVS